MKHDMPDSESTATEYAKFVLLISAIWAVSVWISDSNDTQDLMRSLMAVFFLTFGSFKLIGYRMFVDMFPMYDPIAAKSRNYALAYPFIELGLGAIYLLDWLSGYREVVVIVLLGIGAWGIIKQLRKKNRIKCACLGNVIKLPLTSVSLTEDVAMVAMAIIMLAS